MRHGVITQSGESRNFCCDAKIACMHPSYANLLPVIDRLYEAAVAPGFWPNALTQVATAAGTEHGVVFVASPHLTRAWASEATQPIVQEFWADGWVNRNMRTPVMLAWEDPAFIRDTDAFSPGWLEADQLQRDFLVPRGLGREVATAISLPSGHAMVFSIHFPLKGPPVPDETLHVLNTLRPHLARASVVATTLAEAEISATIRALDILGVPCAVIGAAGRVLGCNELLARDPRIVLRAGNRLALRSASGRALLEDIIARADAGLPEVLSLLLPAEEAVPVAVMHVVPLKGTARDRLDDGLHLVVLTESSSRNVPSVEFLKALFDLTPAEARLARELVRGSTLPEAAQAAGKSHETMRSHLKNLLRKTGTARQAELVGILSHVPRV